MGSSSKRKHKKENKSNKKFPIVVEEDNKYYGIKEIYWIDYYKNITKVEWDTGELTVEPLTQIAEDAPNLVSEYKQRVQSSFEWSNRYDFRKLCDRIQQTGPDRWSFEEIDKMFKTLKRYAGPFGLK